MRFLNQANKKDIYSIGLVFEPNFFRLYYYNDREATTLLGVEEVAYGNKPEFENFASLYPLYAITFNSIYTLVPHGLFDEDKAAEILHFNTSSKSQNVDWNNIIGIDANLIFERDIQGEQFLNQYFPGLQLKHGLVSLIALCRKLKMKSSFSVILQHETQHSLVVFEEDELKLANSIDAKYPEDVLYYLLFTFKTLKINHDNTVYLFGQTTFNLGLRNLLSQYLPNILTGQDLPAEQSFDQESKAADWIGIYARLCAL